MFAEDFIQLKSRFLLRSKIPSIHSFSVLLTFIGGKFQIKLFLTSLCKGGKEFYIAKVENGAFFKVMLADSNHLLIQSFESFNQKQLFGEWGPVLLD